jgi:hypothetical protein
MSGPQNVNIAVTTPAPVTVEFATTQGPAGGQGIQGIPGPAGPPAVTFIFTQSSPSSTWTIAHGLDRYPSVTVVDSTDREVEGDVQYIDANNLIVSFSAPFSGVAYLN